MDYVGPFPRNMLGSSCTPGQTAIPQFHVRHVPEYSSIFFGNEKDSSPKPSSSSNWGGFCQFGFRAFCFHVDFVLAFCFAERIRDLGGLSREPKRKPLAMVQLMFGHRVSRDESWLPASRFLSFLAFWGFCGWVSI